jgi:hypothetical protein
LLNHNGLLLISVPNALTFSNSLKVIFGKIFTGIKRI